jgi:predicted PurR-regulated permease PerM
LAFSVLFLLRLQIENVVENQPGYYNSVAACLDPILNTLFSMRARSMATVEALLKQQPANYEVPRVRHELNEVIDYVTDVAATLGALVAVYPPMATALFQDGGERGRSVSISEVPGL